MSVDFYCNNENFCETMGDDVFQEMGVSWCNHTQPSDEMVITVESAQELLNEVQSSKSKLTAHNKKRRRDFIKFLKYAIENDEAIRIWM